MKSEFRGRIGKESVLTLQYLLQKNNIFLARAKQHKVIFETLTHWLKFLSLQ